MKKIIFILLFLPFLAKGQNWLQMGNNNDKSSLKLAPIFVSYIPNIIGMANKEITQELVKEYFDYRDGFLYWKVVRYRKTHIGDRAGNVSKYKNGCRNVVKINYKKYLAYRIIFLWHHGYMPAEVDHINRNQMDDRIENLRAATRCQNNRNIGSRKNSTSKYIGVWLSPGNRWLASICNNANKTHLGSFSTQEEAALAYNNAAIKLHKEFANLNIIEV